VSRVRHHGDAEIDALLVWCEANALRRARHVVAVGLAYVHGLNAHQIAASSLTEADPWVAIAVPLARRAAEIAVAKRATLVLDEPAWLRLAAATLAAESGRQGPGSLLFRVRRRVNVPLRPDYIRVLVAEAGRGACMTRMSCKTLNQSRIAAVRRAGLPFALFGNGYADSWAARLTAAELALRLPRRVV
jgi:hypothetical protein